MGKRQDVVLAVAQGRQDNGKDVEPVIKVTPERSLCHHFFKIAVSGGNEPDIHMNRHSSA